MDQEYLSSTVEVPRITALLTHTAPAMQQKQGAASFCPYRGRRWNDLSRWVKISRRLLGTLGYRVWWASFFLDAANSWFERERSRLFLAWPSKVQGSSGPKLVVANQKVAALRSAERLGEIDLQVGASSLLEFGILIWKVD